MKLSCISIYYERPERETKEIIPFTISTKRIKYLGISLLKETKDMYSENCKMMIKEIDADTNRWKYIPVLRSEESILSKWIYYPNQSTDSMQSLSSHQWHVSHELEQQQQQKTSKILYGNTKGPR